MTNPLFCKLVDQQRNIEEDHNIKFKGTRLPSKIDVEYREN